MSSISYIRASGDPDYNFAYSDFTVEFFAKTFSSSGCQTLFEISNNESAAANLFSQTRFLTVIENGNLNSYAIQTIAPFYAPANANVITSPIPITSNSKIFYNGELLQSNEYSVSGTTITLSNIAISSSDVLTEVGEILFQIKGTSVTENTQHFISAERFQNQFYLFLDGQSQSSPVPAFNAIPTQVITNTISSGNLYRFGSPALLTIGANRNGQDPLYGEFGDFKITNGVSRHVQSTQIQPLITSSFNDANLGTQPSAIEIDGGNFVDSVSNYCPEEFVPGQIFDTLYLQVYESDNTNLSSNILSFALFKPSILAGPIGSFYGTLTNVYGNILVPWSSLDAGAASVLINNYPASSDSWSITEGVLIVDAEIGSNIEVVSTGPTTYYDVSENSVSIITSNLYANSTSINVENTDPFITPIIGSTGNISNSAVLNVRGQVFINQECITYLYIDRDANTLSGLMRGSAGTGIPEVHIANSRIVNASYNSDIQTLSGVNPRVKIWYTVPLDGTSLQNTATSISTVLVNSGGLPPVTPF